MKVILHVTPHLGGGVGRALSGLIKSSKALSPEILHKVICLEHLEKNQFLEVLEGCQCQVIINPDEKTIFEQVAKADIVQIEFWNHPLIIKFLCEHITVPVRILFWCHISGLNTPVIPISLLDYCHRFLFTSTCSLEAESIKSLPNEMKSKVGVVSSGSVDHLPMRDTRRIGHKVTLGYVGSFNFSKIHPNYFEYLKDVLSSNVRLLMLGDYINIEVMNNQIFDYDISDFVFLPGYANDVFNQLNEIDIFVYLLNPFHYGTAENALLEAMALGVVPIVLDNPAESAIVSDRVNGIIVKDKNQLVDAINNLTLNADLYSELSYRASKNIREKYTYENMVYKINSYYSEIISTKKSLYDYTLIFGVMPSDWFLSFQKNKNVYFENQFNSLSDYEIYAHYEKTKGSIFHFLKYFKDDLLLNEWASNLK